MSLSPKPNVSDGWARDAKLKMSFGHARRDAAFSKEHLSTQSSGEIWSSSMRSAGGIVAGLREVVLTELAELGWEPVSISGDDLAPG